MMEQETRECTISGESHEWKMSGRSLADDAIPVEVYAENLVKVLDAFAQFWPLPGVAALRDQAYTIFYAVRGIGDLAMEQESGLFTDAGAFQVAH